MATSYKVLGQSSPSANTDTDLYTVPAFTSVVVSSLTICNRDSASATYRVAIRPGGETLASKHYAFYDVTLDRNSTQAPVLGWSLSDGDVVTVRSSTTSVSFSLFGTELT